MTQRAVTCPDTWPAYCHGCLCPLVPELGGHTAVDCWDFLALPVGDRARLIALARSPRQRPDLSTPALF